MPGITLPTRHFFNLYHCNGVKACVLFCKGTISVMYLDGFFCVCIARSFRCPVYMIQSKPIHLIWFVLEVGQSEPLCEIYKINVSLHH